MRRRTIFSAIILFFAISPAIAEIKIIEDKTGTLSVSPYLRTDVIMLRNVVTLDNAGKNSKSSYIGLDYSIGIDYLFNDQGPEFFVKAERSGPYGYSAPFIIGSALATSAGEVEVYNGAEYLPYLREFWAEMPLYELPARLKIGLFPYSVGHGIALGGDYENYGALLNAKLKGLEWNVYYGYPDLANKRLGPGIEQEKDQGIGYQHSKADFFASDIKIKAAGSTFQPYVGLLLDRTGSRRLNYFSTPAARDTLGTVGFSGDIVLSGFSYAFEGARNFGCAESDSPGFKNVEHAGYFLFSDAAYEFNKITPHARFVYSSGNKVTEDMVNNGDEFFTSGKNRAFSNYSPLNNNLCDSIYPPMPDSMPLVAMGGGWGLNYGVSRPGTFGDARLFDNLVLYGTGFDCKVTQRCSFTVNWWHLFSAQRGVGMMTDDTGAQAAKALSSDLGNEVDLFINFDINKNMRLTLSSGYFIPGKHYKALRDDADGSLFTPFVRGDGEADPAYQFEFSFEISY